MTKFLEAWPKIKEAVISAWGYIQPVLNFLVDIIANVIIPAVVWFVEMAINGWIQLASFLSDIWTNQVQPVLAMFGDFIHNVIVPAMLWLWETAQSVWKTIAAVISWAWDTIIKPIWDAIYWFIEHIMVPVFKFLWDTVSTVWGWVSSAISTAWGVISGIFESIKNGIGAVAGFISEKVGAIVGFFTDLKDRITSAVSGVWDGFLNGAKSAFNWIADLWNNTIGKIEFEIPFTDIKFSMPDITPFEEGVPAFANGGVITEPTIGLMGETAKARPEIVTPERLMRSVFEDVLASRQGANIVNNFQTQRYSAAELADEVAFRQARQLTGRQR
jgi:phage-related protein